MRRSAAVSRRGPASSKPTGSACASPRTQLLFRNGTDASALPSSSYRSLGYPIQKACAGRFRRLSSPHQKLRCSALHTRSSRAPWNDTWWYPFRSEPRCYREDARASSYGTSLGTSYPHLVHASCSGSS